MEAFLFQYDLGLDMRPGQGCLSFDKAGRLTAQFENETPRAIDITGAEEAAVIAGVGCALLFLKMKDGDDQILCRFTMSALKNAGEMCKVVNYYLQTGHAVIPKERETQICDKCSRPLMEGMNECLFCFSKVGVLKRAFMLMRPFVRQIVVAEAFLTLSSILYLLVPVFSKILIDRYLDPKLGTTSQIILLAGAMLAARTVGELIFIASSRSFNRGSINFANHLRNLAYEKIQKLSLSSLARRTPGDLIRRVTEDTFVIKDFMSDGGRWAVEQAVMFVVSFVILVSVNPWLTLLVFLPVPLAMLVLSRFWRFIIIRYERQWRKNSRSQSILHDIIRGIRTVKSFGNEKAEIEKFKKVSHELAQVSSSNEQLWSILFPAITFLTGIGEFLVLYFGGRSILRDLMQPGTLVLFTMFIGYIYGPLRWLVSFPRWLGEALTSMVKLFEILDEEPDITGKEDPNDIPLEGEVRFNSVSFGYKSYEPVLKDVSLEIRPGEMVGIVGRSGVGKSTMINLLMRLYDPNIGSVLINGTDLRDMTPKHLHENIGVVFQDTFLFAGTILENIAYAKPGATPEEIIAACKMANAHDFIMQTPDGYHTVIGENGHSISGGERQRLAIARAIIKNPSILILDEATSSLDVETEAAIQESLGRLIKGRTTIAIAHRLSTLRQADRLVVLDKGAVAEIGTHIELLKKRGIYYKLVMAQRQTGKLSEQSEEAV